MRKTPICWTAEEFKLVIDQGARFQSENRIFKDKPSFWNAAQQVLPKHRHRPLLTNSHAQVELSKSLRKHLKKPAFIISVPIPSPAIPSVQASIPIADLCPDCLAKMVNLLNTNPCLFAIPDGEGFILINPPK